MEQKYVKKFPMEPNFSQIRLFWGLNADPGSTGRHDEDFQKFTYLFAFPTPN